MFKRFFEKYGMTILYYDGLAICVSAIAITLLTLAADVISQYNLQLSATFKAIFNTLIDISLTAISISTGILILLGIISIFIYDLGDDMMPPM